jgi:threonine dehydratase
MNIVAEPSGAVTTAALRSGALQSAGPTVLIVSGGNIDAALIPTLQSVG